MEAVSGIAEKVNTYLHGVCLEFLKKKKYFVKKNKLTVLPIAMVEGNIAIM